MQHSWNFSIMTRFIKMIHKAYVNDYHSRPVLIFGNGDKHHIFLKNTNALTSGPIKDGMKPLHFQFGVEKWVVMECIKESGWDSICVIHSNQKLIMLSFNHRPSCKYWQSNVLIATWLCRGCDASLYKLRSKFEFSILSPYPSNASAACSVASPPTNR